MVTTGFGSGHGDAFLIRRSDPGDIPEIVSLEVQAFNDPWGEQGIREAMSLYLSSFFVAVAGGRIIGFCGGGIEDTGEAIYGHLCTLVVADEFKSMGVGRELISWIEHDFLQRGATAIELEVRISNRNAINFYRKLGYQEVFTYDSYYKDGEDGVVMMKWFSS
ncbi:MAG: ribosomal protein S18-alanine N-acetyltransferase [Methanocalculus sp.]|uniref:ribosomal protein S18-alanine N-acetyltransferase n=1 Tax=Methanocalculus sp. TaxID=2004547 RepID=UPI00271E6391|nr:ribosomal protein S18-alanine N-acetyltransferase [Methanocalculus sp.]MDO8840977.1 ribosomal protein S18-alanine N-acetyltransferase [Methanocalculus sp.]MDO9539181.1 ribosomal protein S18-alanine N-acetyltransferase [Methanocalculus sp.]